MSEMVLHEGVYYTPADLKAKLARDEAAAAKAKADAAALAVSETGLADAKAVGEQLAKLSERVDQLAEQVVALGSALAEPQKATEDAADGAESDETGKGEGDAPADAGSGASEPSGSDEAAKPKTARTREGA